MPATGIPVRGDELRRLRQRRLWTQGRLASESGVSVTTIHMLEGGRGAQPDTIRKLSDTLGVDPAELLAEEEH